MIKKIWKWIRLRFDSFLPSLIFIAIIVAVGLIIFLNGPRGHHVLEKISDGEIEYTIYLSQEEYEDLYYGASEYSEVTGGELRELLCRLEDILRDKRTMYDYGGN